MNHAKTAFTLAAESPVVTTLPVLFEASVLRFDRKLSIKENLFGRKQFPADWSVRDDVYQKNRCNPPWQTRSHAT